MNNLYPPNVVGGAELSIRCLADAMVRRGHEVIVVRLADEPSSVDVSSSGVRIYKLRHGNIYWPFSGKRPKTLARVAWNIVDLYNLRVARQLASIIQREQPDIVHTSNLLGFSTASWQAVKQAGVPLVHTLRDYYLLCPRSSMSRGGRNCETRCKECAIFAAPRCRASRSVDAVVGISRFILDRHVRHGFFSQSKYRDVIPNIAFNEDSLPANTPNPDGVLRIGYLGRVAPEKGIEQLLNAVRAFSPGEYELWIGGSGDPGYVNSLKERSGPHVRWLGFVDPSVILSSVDVLALPALWHEPFGRGAIEAYEYMLPVIGSRRGGIPEVVEHERTGLLFDPADPDGLTNAIRRIIQEPQALSDMRAWISLKRQAYSEAAVAGAHHRLYTNLIEQHVGA